MTKANFAFPFVADPPKRGWLSPFDEFRANGGISQDVKMTK